MRNFLENIKKSIVENTNKKNVVIAIIGVCLLTVTAIGAVTMLVEEDNKNSTVAEKKEKEAEKKDKVKTSEKTKEETKKEETKKEETKKEEKDTTKNSSSASSVNGGSSSGSSGSSSSSSSSGTTSKPSTGGGTAVTPKPSTGGSSSGGGGTTVTPKPPQQVEVTYYVCHGCSARFNTEAEVLAHLGANCPDFGTSYSIATVWVNK